MENERIARLEESSKSAHKRIDGLENKIENIYELTTSVKEIATEMKAMRTDVNKIDERVVSIEKEPGQNYKDMKNKIVGQIVTFIVGSILTAIGFYVFKK